MARHPALVRAIKTEMADPKFIVRVELIEIHEFSERYPDIRSKTSKSTKENDEPKGGKGGKNTQDGKGKDHQSSPPSRHPHLQTKSIRADHCLHNAVVFPPQLMLRQPKERGRAAMAAFPNSNGRPTLRKITGDNKGGALSRWGVVSTSRKRIGGRGLGEEGFYSG